MDCTGRIVQSKWLFSRFRLYHWPTDASSLSTERSIEGVLKHSPRCFVRVTLKASDCPHGLAISVEGALIRGQWRPEGCPRDDLGW